MNDSPDATAEDLAGGDDLAGEAPLLRPPPWPAASGVRVTDAGATSARNEKGMGGWMAAADGLAPLLFSGDTTARRTEASRASSLAWDASLAALAAAAARDFLVGDGAGTTGPAPPPTTAPLLAAFASIVAAIAAASGAAGGGALGRAALGFAERCFSALGGGQGAAAAAALPSSRWSVRCFRCTGAEGGASVLRELVSQGSL
jgi:hypothetical protein